MWPATVLVGVGDYAVVVASDDPASLDVLSPWVIHDDELDEVTARDLADFVLEVHPSVGDGESETTNVRLQSTLSHGSEHLLGSTDTQRVIDGLGRTLAAYELLHTTDVVLLRTAVVTRGDRAILIPTDRAASVAPRMFERFGLERVDTAIVAVSPSTRQALIPEPLWDTPPPHEVLVVGWWLPYRGGDQDTLPRSQLLAQAMGVASSVTMADAGTFTGIQRLVATIPTTVAPSSDGAAFVRSIRTFMDGHEAV